MKRFLLPLLAAIVLPIPLNAETYYKWHEDAMTDERYISIGLIANEGRPNGILRFWCWPDSSPKNYLRGALDVKHVIDNDGFLKIVDRKKEMVLVSGFNVFPNEVENVISSHPKVLEVGVIGVSDEKTTEAVKAVIVKKDESLTAEEIKKYCKEKLTNYKCPKHIGFAQELPKSNVCKILRRIIKENDLKSSY